MSDLPTASEVMAPKRRGGAARAVAATAATAIGAKLLLWGVALVLLRTLGKSKNAAHQNLLTTATKIAEPPSFLTKKISDTSNAKSA